MAEVAGEQYKVVFEAKIDRFVAQCNTAVADGWVPLGGIQMGNREYFQSFTKEAKKVIKRRPRISKDETTGTVSASTQTES